MEVPAQHASWCHVIDVMVIIYWLDTSVRLHPLHDNFILLYDGSCHVMSWVDTSTKDPHLHVYISKLIISSLAHPHCPGSSCTSLLSSHIRDYALSPSQLPARWETTHCLRRIVSRQRCHEFWFGLLVLLVKKDIFGSHGTCMGTALFSPCWMYRMPSGRCAFDSSLKIHHDELSRWSRLYCYKWQSRHD